MSITVIQLVEIEIHGLAHSKITSQLLLSFAANSKKVSIYQFHSCIKLYLYSIKIYVTHFEI
jgi:hypothetical protein